MGTRRYPPRNLLRHADRATRPELLRRARFPPNSGRARRTIRASRDVGDVVRERARWRFWRAARRRWRTKIRRGGRLSSGRLARDSRHRIIPRSRAAYNTSIATHASEATLIRPASHDGWAPWKPWEPGDGSDIVTQIRAETLRKLRPRNIGPNVAANYDLKAATLALRPQISGASNPKLRA